MITRFKNKMMQFGGNISFIVSGNHFPNGAIQFVSAAPVQKNFTVSINYNDGAEPVVYSSLGSTGKVLNLYNPGHVNINPATANYSGKVFSDGNKNDRIVVINCSDWSVITGISMSGQLFSKTQSLGIPFRLMRNLAGFGATNGLGGGGAYARITDIDAALFSLPALRSLSLGGSSFEITSRYYGYLQPAFINPNLTSLLIGGPGYTGKSFTAANLTAINGVALPQLTSFSFNGGMIGGNDNGFGEGPFPVEWTTLNKLLVFGCNTTAWTSIPDRINSMSNTLTNLNFTYCGQIVSWANDLSNLVNLSTLVLTRCVNFPTTVPGYIASLTKLKNLNMGGVFPVNRQAGAIDAFIDNWYAFVVANAAITGANALPFRGMVFDIRSEDVVNIPAGVQIPTGVYQAPAGFVSGVSNGTPGSSLEKIYVMEVQYGHIWRYRTV